jgi:hypothetical protein
MRYIRAVEVFKQSKAISRTFGVLPDEVFDGLELRPAENEWTGDHWLIRRSLAVVAASGFEVWMGQIYRSTERVYPDGRYSHSIGQIITRIPPRELKLPITALGKPG